MRERLELIHLQTSGVKTFLFDLTARFYPPLQGESTENLFEGDMKLSHNQRAAIDARAGIGSITTRKRTGGDSLISV